MRTALCWIRRGVLLVLLVVLAGSLSPAAARPRASAESDFADVDTFVEAQLQKQGIPGLALAIVDGGRVAHLRGFGGAGGGRAMTPQTPLYIGSVSKSFTALAVMQLVEAGKIDLDAPVRRYLPWFAVADPVATQAISVRHLLNHASGLSDLDYVETLADQASLEQSARALRAARPTAPVGTTWQYFNPNYQVLGLIVEQVSGQRYGDYLRQHIFGPLEMAHSYTSLDEAARDGLSQGYGALFGLAVPLRQPFRAYGLPAGYIISTAEDLAHYAIAMAGGGSYGAARVLSEAGVRQLQSDNRQVRGQPYGMGWFVGDYYGSRLIFHGGDNEYFHSDVLLLPERQLGVVLLSNQNHLLEDFIAYPPLRFGVLDVLTGRRPAEGGSFRLAGLALLAAFLLMLGLGARNLLRLRSWRARSAAWSPARVWLDVALNFAIPAAIVAGVVLGVSAYMQRGFDWSRLFTTLYLPDATALIYAGTAPDLIQGLVKLWWIARARMAPSRRPAYAQR
ncbi:MAG: beta-lactamase family protein [Kouleothrix sp.]|nr:beta-lactamase family protein [Kouleothrix sp.]